MEIIMGSALYGADDLFSSENCGSELIREKQKVAMRSIVKSAIRAATSVGILQDVDQKFIKREWLQR
jgi:hypothetical protein